MSLVNGARRRRWLLRTAVGVEAVASAALVAAAVNNPQPWLVFATVLGNLVAVGLIAATVGSWVTARSERRLKRRIDQVEATVESTRAKASRHEWTQEQSLERIESNGDYVQAGIGRLVWSASSQRRTIRGPTHALFITSNGAGMGHLSRCAAILRAAPETLAGSILTLSTAAPLAAASGLDATYFPSESRSKTSGELWQREFTRAIYQKLYDNQADVIVFDGTWVYPAVTDVAQMTATPLVWLRRGLWRPETELQQIQGWNNYASHLLEPDDIGWRAGTTPDQPITPTCPPITNVKPDDLLRREDALIDLGLDPTRRYALVQLAGGNTVSGPDAAAACEFVRKHSDDLTPVVISSPLDAAAPVNQPGCIAIPGRFPLARYGRAWSFTVTRAGYNSVHENLHTHTPGIYFPSSLTVTDNQELRAEAISSSRLGHVVNSTMDLEVAVQELAQPRVRELMTKEISHTAVPNGAVAAAHFIAASAQDPRPWA